jgi:ribonucleoside-diphosphate reductase alpha chain
VNRYPLPQIDRTTKANRKIGLGIMGFADLLIALGVPYDSARALEVAEELAAVLEDESIAASVALAERRGPFPNFALSRWAEAGAPPIRNATTTTVAPTGTISIIAGCSSGIEPLYAVSYERHVLDGTRLLEVHPAFQREAEERGIFDEALAATLAERGSVRGLDRVPADLQAVYATAHDLGPETHVRMQAAFQRHVHAAVSKTVNLAHDARPSVVAEVYRLAYALGCKGVTVYRDGSRAEQVLRFGDTAQDQVASLRPMEVCPECGSRLLGKEGCIACRSCGWSRCL